MNSQEKSLTERVRRRVEENRIPPSLNSGQLSKAAREAIELAQKYTCDDVQSLEYRLPLDALIGFRPPRRKKQTTKR